MRHRRLSYLEYFYYFLIELLLAMAMMGREWNVLHTGFFVALMFASKEPLVLAIMHLVVGVAVTPTLMNGVYTVVSTLVVLATRLILMRVSRRMNILAVAIDVLLSVVPIAVYIALDGSLLIEGIITIVLDAIFTYIAIVGVFAVVVKRLRLRLEIDEIISLLVMVGALAMGIMNMDIYGYRIYYTIMVLVVILNVSMLEFIPSLLISTAYGIGGGIMTANLELAGVILLMSCFAHVFLRYNRYMALVSILAIDAVGGLYFGAYPEYDYLHLIAVAVGMVIYLLIPPKRLEYGRALYSKGEKRSAIVSFVNRNRIDIVTRINNLAMLFGDIEAEMTGNEYILTNKAGQKYLAEGIMSKVCATCPSRDVCYRALGGDTMAEIEPIVSRAMNAKATSQDISTFLTSRCNRVEEIVSLANRYASQYTKRGIHICDVLDNKRILGEQIGGIGKVMSHFADGMLEGISESSDIERRIMEELGAVGVVVNDVLALERRDSGTYLTLVVRESDKSKRVIRETLERIMRVRLERYEDRACEIEGFVTLRFEPMPHYKLTYGAASEIKEGSDMSGDSRSVVRLGRDKACVVLIDGKGSGAHARENSEHTIGIIEKMYRAGFDSDTILSYANGVLSIRNSEDFSALDMAVVSLETGNVDFVKLGGVTSFIKRSSSVDIIEGSSLPLGVLDEAEPSIERRALSEGDMVLIVSDGVTDAIGVSKVREMLLNTSSTNVQKVADEVVLLSTEMGAIDDVTALTFKLTRVA